MATSKNPTHASYCYYKLTNLSLNHEDTCIVLNRILTVDPKSHNGIWVICKDYSSLFEPINSKQMVSNLCASPKHHKIGLFLTFTWNQAERLGLKEIWNWVDYKIWNKFYPMYLNWTHAVKK